MKRAALLFSPLFLVACISQANRTCTSTDGTICTAYTGIAWTDPQVRDNCARTTGTVGPGSACAASPYGTCVLLDGQVTETRVHSYTVGATEAIVEAACCSGGGSSATWVSASGARRPCPAGGGIDEGI